MKTRLAFVLVLLLAACYSPTAPLATPTDPAATVTVPAATVSVLLATPTVPAATVTVLPPIATLPPMNLTPVTPAASEIASLSGNAPVTGEPFTITANSNLRVNWQQASTGDFVLAITNTDPSQTGTEKGRVVFESITGPSAMFSDYEFIPGQYQIVVESADGPWKVWVDYVGPGE